jgi:hypothetical protein
MTVVVLSVLTTKDIFISIGNSRWNTFYSAVNNSNANVILFSLFLRIILNQLDNET